MLPAGGLLYPSLASRPLLSSPKGCTFALLSPSIKVPASSVARPERIPLLIRMYTFCPHKVYVLPPQSPPAPNEHPAASPSASALYHPLPYRFCRGAEEGCRRKSLPLWCFPRREASFIRSVQRTAMSRPQPIRIRGKVRGADSLPDTRGRIVSSKNKRYDYPNYIYFDKGAHIQLPFHLFD